MAHSYDIAGYTYDGAFYCCGGCLPDEAERDDVGTVYESDEWDYYPTCDCCGETCENVTLTAYGQAVFDAKYTARTDESWRACPTCGVRTQIGEDVYDKVRLFTTECSHVVTVRDWQAAEEL